MKKNLSFVLCITMFFCFCHAVFAKEGTKDEAEIEAKLLNANTSAINISAKSAVLMESSTGKVLFSKNETAAYSPASVTKIMTLLLACEALERGAFKLSDTVIVSEYAASMGGSQVFLEEGESITVEELFKSTIIASANDSAVALAELVSGSESVFVSKMNAKAMELGLSSSNFENVTGLDDTTVNHVTSALDIAIMSRELIKHEIILEYASLWQDTIRGGEFTLTNTNRLVRYYDGCNGLKTGSTDKAGYCMSATAKRDGIQFIAVIMGAETRDIRNEEAKLLLNFGFSSYSLFSSPERDLEEVAVKGGKSDKATLYSTEFEAIIPKGAKVEMKYNLPNEVYAPISEGDPLGAVEYFIGDEKIGESAVYSRSTVEKIGYFDLYLRIILALLGKSL